MTDNPILLPAQDGAWAGQVVDIVSGGHFHGMPLAVDLYGLLQALGHPGLADQRALPALRRRRPQQGAGARSSSGPAPTATASAIPSCWPSGRRARGMMLPEYATAALANWIWGQAMPSHLMSLPTGQRAGGSRLHGRQRGDPRLRGAAPARPRRWAIELAYGAQAADLRREMRHLPSRAGREEAGAGKAPVDWYPIPEAARRLSPAGEATVAAVRGYLPTVVEDRALSGELQALADAGPWPGEIVAAVRGEVALD